MNKYLKAFLTSLTLAAAAFVGHVAGPDAASPKHEHTRVTFDCETCFDVLTNFVGNSHPRPTPPPAASTAPVESETETEGPPAPEESE